MACYIHPDREAVANCSVCGRQICSECSVIIGDSSYCKNCINTLLDSDSDNIVDESNTIENIEPISKPKTVPYDESSNDVDSVDSSEEIVVPVEKAPENYEPEYDYQTQYVESYGDEDFEEDSYYENPESVPEPQDDYKEVVADKVFSQPSPEDIESKYEKYLDDIYYDEVGEDAPINNQYVEPTYNEARNVQYRELVNNQYVEPNYDSPRNQYREPIYQEDYYDDDFIVPAHQQSRGQGQSYEEIKRKLDAENMRISGQRRYDDYPRVREDYPRANDDYGRRNPQNLDDIQRMHYQEVPKKDNSFTTVEIILTVILIILIIIVVFYIIYLFALSSSYSTVMDAVMGLVQNPSLFFSNLIH